MGITAAANALCIVLFPLHLSVCMTLYMVTDHVCRGGFYRRMLCTSVSVSNKLHQEEIKLLDHSIYFEALYLFQYLDSRLETLDIKT